MNPPRPSLRLDLKELSPPPAPHTRKMVWAVAVSLMGGILYFLFSTLIAVNSPPASATNSEATSTHQGDQVSDRVPSLSPLEPVQPISTGSRLAALTTAPHPIIPVASTPKPVTTSSDQPSKAPPTALIPLTVSTFFNPPTESRVAVPDPPLPLARLSPGLSSSPVASHEVSAPERSPQEASPVDVARTPEAAGIVDLSAQTAAPDNRLQLAGLIHVPGQRSMPALDQLPKDRLSEPEPEPLLDPLTSALNEGEWITETIRRKDTLTSVLQRLGFGIREALALVELEPASVLERIHPGQEIHITRLPPEEGHPKPRLGKLKFQLSQFETLLVRRRDNGYVADVIRQEPEVRYRLSRATIHHDLMSAAQKAGIPRDIVYSVANILGWQIDFTRDIQPGDRFKVIYEERYLDGHLVGHGQVVATELTTRQRKFQAIRHINENGQTTYYTPTGEGVQSSFLRSPIKFARVTSNFSKRRLHPIAKTWRAHNGVDYGAPMNTPIRATSDGVVEFVGTKTGYGKTLILRHGSKYKTLYAHLNRYQKGIQVGKRVQQGDIIGYVGQTGWATGPHLHYEFRVNGRHMNPVTVELPKSPPIDPQHMDDFTREAAFWVARLDRNDQVQFALKAP